jgi:hypothetical protein
MYKILINFKNIFQFFFPDKMRTLLPGLQRLAVRCTASALHVDLGTACTLRPGRQRDHYLVGIIDFFSILFY